MNDWQPIETAPKDRPILGWIPFAIEPGGAHNIIKWMDDEWYEWEGPPLLEYQPTHWLPLPEPPTTQWGGEGK